MWKKEVIDHRREWQNEVRWEESTHLNPTKTSAYGKQPLEMLEVDILHCFWFTEDDTMLRFLKCFSQSSEKQSHADVLLPPTKQFLYLDLDRHITGYLLSVGSYGAFIKLLICTKAMLLITVTDSYSVASIHLLHYCHFRKRSWNKWESHF